MKIKNKGIINKHFLDSLLLFLGVLVVVLTFITFLEDAQKNDKVFSKNFDDKDKIDSGK